MNQTVASCHAQATNVHSSMQQGGRRGGLIQGQRSGVSRLRSHSSRANLVPVLTRSRSGPQAGTRLTNTVTGSVVSLRAPSAATCDTLETQREVKGQTLSQTGTFGHTNRRQHQLTRDHTIQTGPST